MLLKAECNCQRLRAPWPALYSRRVSNQQNWLHISRAVTAMRDGVKDRRTPESPRMRECTPNSASRPKSSRKPWMCSVSSGLLPRPSSPCRAASFMSISLNSFVKPSSASLRTRTCCFSHLCQSLRKDNTLGCPDPSSPSDNECWVFVCTH